MHKDINKIIQTITPIENEDMQSIIDAFKSYFKHLYWDSGTLYLWIGTHFIAFNKKMQSKFIRQVLQKLLNQEFIQSNDGDKILSELIYNCESPEIKAEDTKKYLNVRNGTLIFSPDGNVKLAKHNPKYNMKYVLAYLYDENATAARFKKFLQETIEEPEAIMVLLEYLGYVLLDQKFALEKALFLLGNGSNGKSVLIQTIKKLFGEYNLSYVGLSKLSNENAAVLLEGKLLNIGSDESKHKIDSSLFKKMVSAEPVQVKKLYQDIYTLTNIPRLIFAANRLQNSDDTSNGYLRRLMIITFNNTFEKNASKPTVEDELEAELSGILNMVLEGMWRLLEQGKFTESRKIDMALLAYTKNLDPAKRFIEDYQITSDLDCRLKDDTLYKYYIEWCKSEGIRPINQLNRQELKNELESYGFMPYRNNKIKGFKVSTKQSIFEETEEENDDFMYLPASNTKNTKIPNITKNPKRKNKLPTQEYSSYDYDNTEYL